MTAPPPPPDCHLITALMEGSTLTHTQCNTIATLMTSVLCLPTRALEYVGHTLNPLTLHWHCTTAERGDSDPVYSIGLLSEMAEEGIRMINVGTAQDIVIPQKNVSIHAIVHDITFYLRLVSFMYNVYWSICFACMCIQCILEHLLCINSLSFSGIGNEAF